MLFKKHKINGLMPYKSVGAAIICLSAFLLCACGSNKNEISVLVTDGKGFEVTSGNPVKITPGEDAIFTIALNDDYEIIQISDPEAQYNDGILTLPNRFYPETVEICAEINPKLCKFFFENPQSGGKLTSSVPQGKVESGSYISLAAVPKTGAVFLGWSEGAMLYNGGELISESDQCVYRLTKDTVIYANFDMSKVKRTPSKVKTVDDIKDEYTRTVVYDANGGSYGNGKTLYLTDVSTRYYKMPNSMMSDGTFVREGYMLTGYNTKADGSGVQYGTGHPILIDTDGDMFTLYCTWKKTTDESCFSVEAFADGVAITEYHGDGAEVVVPEYIGGKEVLKIKEYAFNDESFEALYLPRRLREVDDYAVMNCKSMKTLFMFDGESKISDDSFYGASSLKTLMLNAAVAPRYTSSGISFNRKWQRFYLGGDQNRIVIVSGSSSHCGFNSAMFDELMNHEYYIAQCGTHGSMNHLLDLEIYYHDIHKGDIIIYAPEQLEAVMGSDILDKLNFVCYEGCYNVFSYVDISHFKNVFGALCEFNNERFNMPPLSYQAYTSGFSDPYNDRANPVTKFNSDDFFFGANGIFRFEKGVISDENAARLNAIFAKIEEKGATAVMSYPPTNQNAVRPDTLNDASIDVFNADMRERIHIPLISDMRDYLFEGKYMDNTDYHVNDAARDIRTQNLYRDLRAYLDSVEE